MKDELKVMEADKLFDELGYELSYDDDNNIYYEKNWDVKNVTETIAFNAYHKAVEISYNYAGFDASLDMHKYMAIHAKLKELGWLKKL